MNPHIDTRLLVDKQVKRYAVPRPLSTFVLSSHDILTINDNIIRSALVIRIMRYVSFQPWGASHAEAKRSSRSIQRIVDKVWTANPDMDNISSFVSGGGVVWRPIVISFDSKGNERLKLPQKWSEMRMCPGDRFGWLASRQPPLYKSKGVTGGLEDDLEVDLSPKISRTIKELHDGKRKASDGPLDILWDCRFLLRFDLAKIPQYIAVSLALGHSQLRVEPNTRWYWPRIVWMRPGFQPDTLALIPLEQQDQEGVVPLANPSAWIRIYWIRTLEAI